MRILPRVLGHLMVPFGLASLIGCIAQGTADLGNPIADPNNPANGTDGGVPGNGSDGGSTLGPSGLPCDVDMVLNATCRSCHGTIPSGGSTLRLMIYEDLLAMSKMDPTVTEAALAVTRMGNGTMPPGGGASSADITTLSNWISAGYPRGSCSMTTDGGLPSDPYSTPSVCTSNATGSRRDNSSMRPGEACISCHSGGEGPLYAFAGTAYPTAHEPNNCMGASGTSFAGAQVIIIGADGNQLPLTLNSAGNFYTYSQVAMPYTAKITYMGRERVMTTPQTVGDCNTCHSETGNTSAPGRVMMP